MVAVFADPPVRNANLLFDSEGPYGIMITGIETPYPRASEVPDSIVMVAREDRALDDDPPLPVPTLFHRAPEWASRSRQCAEGTLVQGMHWAMLAQKGIKFPEDDMAKLEPRFWRRYHGLRVSARRIVNALLADLYAEAIPDHRLRIIRRYLHSWRPSLYRAWCRGGDRAWQLAETFPFLAVMIYHERPPWRWDELEDAQQEARRLVARGAKLSTVAEAMGELPMALRKLRPGVLHRAPVLLAKHPEVVSHHCPDTVPKQRAWLRALSAVSDNEDFALWAARHWERLGYWRDLPDTVRDMSDWAKVARKHRAVDGLSDVDVERVLNAIRATEFQALANQLAIWRHETKQLSPLGRMFNPAMSPHTAIQASHEWHERAALQEAADVPFPEPWYDGETLGQYVIEPIADSMALTRYGMALHNCATTYAHSVANGRCFLYVVKQDDKPIAMCELERRGELPELAQLSGPCNRPLPKALSRKVRGWLKRMHKREGKGRMPEPRTASAVSTVDYFDEDLPF